MTNDLILITGIGGPAGKSAATYVREKGFHVLGTDMREVDAPADGFRLVPAVNDPAFASLLLSLIERERPSLFIPTVSEELPVVARLAHEIRARGCCVFISPAGAIDTAHDKLRTMRFYEHTDVPVPRTFDEWLQRERVVGELGFPFLAKPRVGRGGRGVVLYWSPEEFLAEKRDGLLFQEFIPGEEYDVNLFVDGEDSLSICIVLRKTALKQGLTGNALSVERATHPGAADLGRRAAALLGLTGPLDMDVRLRADGTPVLIEINARVGGNVLAAPEVLDSLLLAWEREKRTGSTINRRNRHATTMDA